MNIPFGYPFLFRPLLHAQNYTWCRANPTMKMSIFGLLTIPTSRTSELVVGMTTDDDLPRTSLSFRPHRSRRPDGRTWQGNGRHNWSPIWPFVVSARILLFGRRSVQLIFRWFISTYLPRHAATRHRRPNPLQTPLYFRSFFPSRGRSSTSTTGFTASAPRNANDAVEAVRHRWGSGNKLGGERL